MRQIHLEIFNIPSQTETGEEMHTHIFACGMRMIGYISSGKEYLTGKYYLTTRDVEKVDCKRCLKTL